MPIYDELPIDPDLAPDDPSEPHLPGPLPEPRRVHRHRARPDVLVVIALGGALGTLARAGLGQAFPNTTGHFPSTTLAINIGGSFLLGVLLVAILERLRTPRHLGPFVASGVLGGFTTFSTFMVGTAQLARHGEITAAIGYLAASVGGGCAAALGGIMAGHALADPRVGGEAATGHGREHRADADRAEPGRPAFSDTEATR